MRGVKHSVTIAGHRTSITLEPPFFEALKEIAAGEGLSLSALVRRIDAARGGQGLSRALRLFVLEHYRAAAASGERGAASAVRRSR
jgi:predicted DNA-binding ribbon-helix-helix protein